MLQRARQHRRAWGKMICSSAGEGGHVPVLQWPGSTDVLGIVKHALSRPRVGTLPFCSGPGRTSVAGTVRRALQLPKKIALTF